MIFQVELTTSSSTDGSVADPGEGVFPYDKGSSVPVIAQPSLGYQSVNWTETGVGAIADPDSPSTTITMDDSYAIQANFSNASTIFVDGFESGNTTMWSLKTSLTRTDRMSWPRIEKCLVVELVLISTISDLATTPSPCPGHHG